MLLVGTDKQKLLEHLPDTFLLLDDGELSDALEFPRRKVTRFDYKKHSLNPLKDIDRKKARQLARLIYYAYPQGENTLTVRNGKRALARLLLEATRLDRIRGDDRKPEIAEALGAIDDILFSDVLEDVLCRARNFPLDGILLVRLNRAELDELDCFILGNILIQHYQGHVVVPDFGFYGCPLHTALIRQNRLTAGVNFLDETPLKNNLLLIKDKLPAHCTAKDAATLAEYAGLIPNTNAYNEYIQRAVR